MKKSVSLTAIAYVLATIFLLIIPINVQASPIIENEKFINNHELIMEEVVQQNKVIEKLNKTNRKEEFYFWGRENCGKSILGDFWFLE